MYLGKVSIKFQTFLIKEWRHTKEKLKNNIENPWIAILYGKISLS